MASTHHAMRHQLAAMMIVALLAVVFGWPTQGGDFLSGDDQRLVVDHYLVNHPSLSNAGRLMVTLHDDLYQPLPMLTLQLDFARAEPTPDRRYPVSASAFHATNILLHAINSVLALVLARRLTDCRRVGLLVGAMFACHPFALEPVAWISGRMMLLAAMFSMLTMLACLGRGETRSAAHPVAAVLAWLAATASKILPSVPLAALWVDYQRHHRQSADATPELDTTTPTTQGATHLAAVMPMRTRAMYAVLIAISLGGSVMAWDATRRAGFIEGVQAERTTSPPVHALLSAGYYLRNYVWPTQLAAWSPPPEHVTLTSPDSLASMAMLAAFVVLVLLARRWNRAAYMGLMIFAILLAPFLAAGAARRFLAADRYMYLPMLGLHLAVSAVAVSLWDRLARRIPRVHSGILVGAPVLMLLLTWMTTAWRLAPTWAVTIRRERRIVEVYPDSEAAHAELAKAHNFQGDPDGALAVVAIARLRWSDSPRLAAAAGEAYRLKDDPMAAVQEFSHALEVMPRHLHTRYRYAQSLDANGQTELALLQYEHILDINPDYFPAILAIARFHRAENRYDDAVRGFERAIEINPYHRDSRFELAELLISHGDWQTAEEHLRSILAIDPVDAPAKLNLAVTLARQNRGEAALRIYDELLAVEPANPVIQINRASVLASMGHLEDAEEEFRDILERHPESRDATIGLHGVLQEQGRYGELPDLWRLFIAVDGDLYRNRVWLEWSLALAEEDIDTSAPRVNGMETAGRCYHDFRRWAVAWKYLTTNDAASFRDAIGPPVFDGLDTTERMEQSRVLTLALRKLPDDLREQPVASYALARAALHGGDFDLARAAIDTLKQQTSELTWQYAAAEVLLQLK